MRIIEGKMRMDLDTKNNGEICVFRFIEPETFPGFWENLAADHYSYLMNKTREAVRTKVIFFNH